jgi:GxxExxY protein
METDLITRKIIGAAMTVHSELGPGLLESVYESCLWRELKESGMRAERQVQLPLVYKGETIESGFRLDLLVENEVIVELKTVESLLAIHEAQLLTYLKLSGKRVGLLINFNSVHLRGGIKRLVNKFHE